MNWPIYFAPNLHLGSPDSGVALCLLWTPQDRVLPHLDAADYALAGNLYSRDGISYILESAGTILGGILGAILSVPTASVIWSAIKTWNEHGDGDPHDDGDDRVPAARVAAPANGS